MPGSPPSDRRNPDALDRAAEIARRLSSDATPTEILPGRSTLVVEESDRHGDRHGDSSGDSSGDRNGAALQAIDAAPSPPAVVAGQEAGSSAARPGGTAADAATVAASLLPDESRFASATDALREDELRRSRLLARFGLLLGGAVAIALLFLPGDPAMTRLTYGAVAIASLGNLWLHRLASRPEGNVGRRLAIIWIVNSFAVSAGVIYFGVFSAAAVVVLLGVYFMALGQSLTLAAIVYLTCASVHGGVAILVLCGAMSDPGLIHAAYLPRDVLLIVEGLIQLVLLAAFVMARASRGVTLSAVTQHERVVRALAQREALLHEARQDLERALQLGGVGRFTGQTLGSFRLGPILGRGSMGEVYEAVRVTSGEPAAVKLLQPASMGNPGYLMRFLREVEVAAAIEFPHVVRVLEVGDASAPVPYLAMERLRGRDLAQLLREQRRLGGPQLIDLVSQTGLGITAAAAAGVVHRDLKPQNLFLAEQPAGPAIWKVLDFGVSKLLGAHGFLTQGQVVGTPVYMAPEQAQGHEVDQRADLYALAAIAYRCITGHLPYRAADVPTIMYQVVYRMPIRPGALCEVPEDVDAALLIAMAKDPAHRFDTADQLSAALADALDGRLPERLRDRARELARAHPWRAGP